MTALSHWDNAESQNDFISFPYDSENSKKKLLHLYTLITKANMLGFAKT